MRKFLICTTALIAVPAMAQAQDAPQERRSLGSGEAIIVTAERRAQNVQDVPISIVAISGEELRNRGIDDLSDLQSAVPSLSFVDNGNTKFVNIRGVGITESAPNQTVGIAVHLDGAYIAREFVFNDAFFDLASVQVLRGPQGTYSGQNASGGAIFIESARPDLNAVTGFAEMNIGNFDRRQISGAVSTPLTDKLAVRIALQAETRDSYYTNLGPTGNPGANGVPNQPGNLSRYLGRAQLLFEPSDTLELRLIHQFSQLQTDGTARQRYTAAELADPFVLNYDYSDSEQDTHYNRTTGIIAWDATESFRVNVNAAYQTMEHYTATDSDRTSALIEPTVGVSGGWTDIEDEYFTGEINLVSTGSGPFEWTVGANMLDYSQNAGVWLPRSQMEIDTNSGLFLSLDLFRKNQAIFGEVGYSLSDALQVKVGARYNHEENGFYDTSYVTRSGPDGAPGPAFNPPFQSFNNMTGRALVNWTPNDDTLVYATVSRGYKPGGVSPPGEAYGSEVVTNFELGWKADWLDGALQTSISGFWMDYDGFQASIATDPNNPTTRITKNVDDTRIKGIEALIGINTGGLRADVSTSILSAEYGTLNVFMPPGTNGNAGPELIDLAGRQINFAPKFSVSGGLAYDIPVGDDGFIVPSVRVSHVSGQYVTFFQAPYHLIPTRTLVDARLSFEPNDSWKVTAYVTNLFDETYVATASGTTNGIGEFGLGAPREFGVTLGFNF